MAGISTRADPPFCFGTASVHSESACGFATTLDAESATALATLVPLLGCGEEAAALAFDGLAEREGDLCTRLALCDIAREERVHEGWLRGLASALPSIDARTLQRAARRFHIDLGRGSTLEHLARIAAVDAAVCTILSRLLRLGGPIAADLRITSLLMRIRRDEVRHVTLSRRIVLARTPGRDFEDAAAAAREALANVLTLASDAFEALAVDPARLDRDLRILPDGLLRE